MGAKELAARENWQEAANKTGIDGVMSFRDAIQVFLTENNLSDIINVGKAKKIHYRNGKNGFVLDTKIENKKNGKVIFIENKKGDNGGNAHERAYKYLPFSGTVKIIREKYKVGDVAVFIVFSGETFKGEKYKTEIDSIFEDFPNVYFIDEGIAEKRIEAIKSILENIL